MGKHLTLDQRITIQVELERNTPIKAIARMIGKAPRTVAREIKQRRATRNAKPYGRTNNRCIRRDRCPGVIKGQSIHHAVWQQRERLPVCERTIRYFWAGNLFTARRGVLRRACRLKPRKGKRKEHKLDTKCREGRTYELYRRYVEELRPRPWCRWTP